MPKYLDETGLAHFWENIKDKVNHIDVISPYLKGTSIYIAHKNNHVLFDCGDSDDTTRITNFLADKLGTEKLDAVVISHFDSDHTGGFSAVADFCDSDTDIFIQMVPTSSNTYIATYTSELSILNGIVSQNSLKTPIVPTEGATYSYGDISIELHNTTTDNRSIYDSTPSEAYAYNSGSSGLNNYSLISYVEINGFVICCAGDVEAAAQRLNHQYVRKCDLAFTPHHISQVNGYLPWYMDMAPVYWLGTTSASTFGDRIYVLNRYIVKLLRYNYIDDVLMTHDDDLVVSVDNNIPRIVKGESLVGTIGTENLKEYYTNFFQILPPAYYHDDPYVLYTMTLSDLIGALIGGGTDTYTLEPTMFDENMTIRQELRQLGVNTSGITISFSTGRYLTVELHASTGQFYQRLIIFGSVDTSTGHGVLYEHQGMSFKYVFDTAQTANALDLSNYLSSEQLSRLAIANKAIVMTAGGLPITLLRTATTGASIDNGAVSLFGFATNTAMTSIYRGYYNPSNHQLTVSNRTFDSATLSYSSIKYIAVVE